MVACSPNNNETNDTFDSDSSISFLPIEKRLAFMSGHVEAGMELYKLNKLKMAAPHLLHPVSETHKSEKKNLDELGFDSKVFEKVSQSLRKNKSAKEIGDLLNAASENLKLITNRVGGNPKEIIRFLLLTVDKEYSLSFQNNKIDNIVEYLDAWGFVKVAIFHARNIDDKEYSKNLVKNLKYLHSLWNDGPLPTKKPKSPDLMKSEIKKILNTL